jgi:hypothetical protein
MQDRIAPVQIVLGIPGPWETAQDLTQAVAALDVGFAVCEGELVNSATNQHFRLELVEHDPELRRTYELANRRSLSPADLALIGGHKHTAYLAGTGGSLEAARSMMQAAAVLLAAGGFAVKVETAGVAHSAHDWLAQTSRREMHVGALYIAYVALVGHGGEYYSCGMHNLGFGDAIVAGLVAAQAGDLLRGFLMSVIHEQPILISGQSVVQDAQGTRYLLTHEPCRAFPQDDPFYNPYGVWRLLPQELWLAEIAGD